LSFFCCLHAFKYQFCFGIYCTSILRLSKPQSETPAEFDIIEPDLVDMDIAIDIIR